MRPMVPSATPVRIRFVPLTLLRRIPIRITLKYIDSLLCSATKHVPGSCLSAQNAGKNLENPEFAFIIENMICCINTGGRYFDKIFPVRLSQGYFRNKSI